MNYETLKNNINKSLENYEKTNDEEHLADIVRTLNAYGYPMRRVLYMKLLCQMNIFDENLDDLIDDKGNTIGTIKNFEVVFFGN